MNISIHAPARGATVKSCFINFIKEISIHAPARGATFWLTNGFSKSVFQSTLPRGERRGSITKVTEFGDFNPRSREGSDGILCGVSNKQAISIHAPARGATNSFRCNSHIHYNFNRSNTRFQIINWQHLRFIKNNYTVGHIVEFSAF